jgi:aspartyl-tRNA(Asn)/glutamyl-tRNA(Gln) amidotransferase subunit C
MISKDEVKHIAKLSRLELSEAETEKMQKDLSEILDYFNLLKKAPKIKEISTGTSDLKATRKDEVQTISEGMRERLIQAAPDKKDGYIKVKAIF